MKDKEQNLIKTMIEEGDELFLKLLDDYPILENNDHRQETLLLNLMTNCVSRLHLLGWTEKDLCNEVFDWCAIARSWQEE
jgi:hypothetical protein